MAANPISLCLISRPMHLLAVREFVENNPDQFFVVLVSYSQDKNEREAIQKQLHVFDIGNVKVLEKFPWFSSDLLNVYLFLLLSLKLRFQYGKLNQLLLSGGVKSRILYKHFTFNHLILIDEGASSLWKIPHTIQTKIPFRQATGFGKLYRHFGVNDLKVKSPFSVFTIYEQFWNKAPNVVPNKLLFWNKFMKDLPLRKNQVLILGTTYAKFGLKKNEYEELLTGKIASYSSAEIYYKYHKKEKDPIDLPDVKILKTRLPIESHFIAHRYFPETIIAINSTSLRIIQLVKPEVNIVNIDLKFK